MADDPRTQFIKAATWHGTLDDADSCLLAHPELAAGDIHTAAITGNVEAVRRYLAEDPGSAGAVSEPYGGTALVYLCLSKYLRLHKVKSNDFMQAATALLDTGADPNAGFWTTGEFPEFETALYGAAGVAHDAALTQLLLKYGADPNDGEAVYHSPETHDNEVLKLLVETGRLTQENLSVMLIRKHDWHDYDGVKYLLEQGANPEGIPGRGWHALHHALQRSNALPIIALLIHYGADPHSVSKGLTALARAAREGRADVLQLLAEKGITPGPEGLDKLIAGCALGDEAAVRIMLEQSPWLWQEIMALGSELLARFCLNGNVQGINRLLDIGIAVDTPYKTGDGYFGIPEGSLPVHVAAWLGRPAIVQLLIARGATVDKPDNKGNTPLALAVRACVDSYWTERRSTGSIKALLDAGASPGNILVPTGYAEADEILRAALSK